MYYITKIKIVNVRCFKSLELSFKEKEEIKLWNTFLGDNSTGKTTLLKCIALSLCDQSSAAGLLRESEQGYIRNGAKKGIIETTLINENDKECRIINTISKVKGQKTSFETLEQTIKGDKNPWDKIFICAYGIGRGVSGTGDIAGYSSISAVYNLFNYSEGLQNPELVFRRNLDKVDEIKKMLKIALNLTYESTIELEDDGIKIEGGTWKKKIPLRDLADGYRSTFQWITDFLGWIISFDNKLDLSEIKGIILVDSLEEHLHPQWQRIIVKKLKSIFENIQFIVTTHSPLVASGTTDFKNMNLIELYHKNDEVLKTIIEKEEVYGKRADQVLRSQAFDMSSTISPGAENNVVKYFNLKSKKDSIGLDELELKEFSELDLKVNKDYTLKDNIHEEEVEKVIHYVFDKLLKKKPDEIHDMIIKKELRALFGDIENEKN